LDAYAWDLACFVLDYGDEIQYFVYKKFPTSTYNAKAVQQKMIKAVNT
jgi:hypothetical protein